MVEPVSVRLSFRLSLYPLAQKRYVLQPHAGSFVKVAISCQKSFQNVHEDDTIACTS